MSHISQLASRVGGEGEWGIKFPLSLHYLAQGEWQGRGLRFPPLGLSQFRRGDRHCGTLQHRYICTLWCVLGLLAPPEVRQGKTSPELDTHTLVKQQIRDQDNTKKIA
jgi:hypothetical protein